MGYLKEFETGGRHLLASCVGLALGSAMMAYAGSLFAPPLIKEFGWSKAQFALSGSLSLFSMLFVPVAGRFTDRFGPRVAAMVGFTVLPLTFLALSFMTGQIWQFFAISVIQHMFGILTTTVVFVRVIIERFDSARGIALSLLMTGAPLAGALVTPLLSELIDTDGWRAGYRAMALLSVIGGIVAISLMGNGPRKPGAPAAERSRSPAMPLRQFGGMAKNPLFLLLLGGMFLCNIPQIIVLSQLKLVLAESNAPSQLATWIVSLYAGGVIVGRFIAGLALDRVPAHIVAIFSLGIPAIGYMALASDFDAGWVLAGSVLLIGLAQGSEGDIGPTSPRASSVSRTTASFTAS